MWNIKKHIKKQRNKETKQIPKIIDTETRLVMGKEWGIEGGKMSEGGQKVQTSSCKIRKPQRCNAQHGDYC